MALVMEATSFGEWVPIGASRGAGEAAVLTEVLTEDTEGAMEETDGGATFGDRGIKGEAIDAAVADDCPLKFCVASSSSGGT